jgi:hypothetical protein
LSVCFTDNRNKLPLLSKFRKKKMRRLEYAIQEEDQEQCITDTL